MDCIWLEVGGYVSWKFLFFLMWVANMDNSGFFFFFFFFLERNWKQSCIKKMVPIANEVTARDYITNLLQGFEFYWCVANF